MRRMMGPVVGLGLILLASGCDRQGLMSMIQEPPARKTTVRAAQLDPTWKTFTAEVVGVADGDTITVLDRDRTQSRIRLLGIDAPEKAQAFGVRSKEHLSGLVFRKTVEIRWKHQDRYGRVLGQVFVSGQDANLAQVRAGFAWHYKQFEREQSMEDRELYAAAESEARTQRLGLWSDPDPTPPWEFRRQ